MHRTLHILVPFFILLFASCSFSPNELKLAERVMETSPDSALQILQHMQPTNTLTDENRAMYGLLYFQALEKTNKPLKPDSLIKFSINYYSTHNDNSHLAACYYYHAKMLKIAQRFDDATLLYLKAMDLLQNKKANYVLLGKIYSDMGDICLIQMEYKESLKKFQESISYFNKSRNKTEASYRIIAIGRVYRFLKDYKKAYQYYHLALSQTSDSLVQGAAIQEIGVNYFWAKQYDSAEYFLKKSLRYPYKGTNYAIRCFNLADLFFDRAQYDSAFCYATLTLKYPTTFFNQRDCYRILANTEYTRKDYKQMAFYLAKYQACTDSVRKIEAQTKSSVLENLYEVKGKATTTKTYLFLLGCILPAIVLLSILIVIRLRKRNKGKEKELEQVTKKLSNKQALLRDSVIQKINETRLMQAATYKKSTISERELIDKEIYNVCLHINDWHAFSNLMNRVFNDIITKLETKYSDISRKELTWCCLYLLDIPTPDIALVLDSQPGSLYKLKQRMAQKMNLKSMKEFDKVLHELSEAD
jgi:tetratricopeptide (TPR) repeat protein